MSFLNKREDKSWYPNSLINRINKSKKDVVYTCYGWSIKMGGGVYIKYRDKADDWIVFVCNKFWQERSFVHTDKSITNSYRGYWIPGGWRSDPYIIKMFSKYAYGSSALEEAVFCAKINSAKYRIYTLIKITLIITALYLLHPFIVSVWNILMYELGIVGAG